MFDKKIEQVYNRGIETKGARPRKEVFTMKKYTTSLFSAAFTGRKGAGWRYMDSIKGLVNGNAGNIVERSVTMNNGLEYHQDHVEWFKGSDIEALGMSVKSYKASLGEAKTFTATEKAGIINEYFERCPSTVWAWGAIVNDEVVYYEMNATEFRSFLESDLWKMESKKLRQTVCATKVIAWMESRI